jgi:hypothetical protein
MTLIISESNPDRFKINVLFIFLGIGMLGAGAICMPRWYSYFQIEDGELIYKMAFHKPVRTALKKYRYIYKAYYEHRTVISGFIGRPSHFSYYIVISTVMLRSEILSNINKIPSSPETLKIKYTSKMYKLLFDQLDEKQQKRLMAAFNR